tara:strand:+ start:391 stop:948 length:558 start_codon:yes stop_codon:yes gene_type:complete
MADPDLDEFRRRMQGALDVLKNEFGGLRTGRASAALIEPVMVEAYGSSMPINQVATVNVADSRMVSVQVWDQGLIASVEKAIRNSELGLNPATDGNVIRIPIPQLSEERRVELTKIANKYSEQARVAVRNIRRDGMDQLKKQEKDGEISQDEQRAWGEDLQLLTNDFVKEIDTALSSKESEIMQV